MWRVHGEGEVCARVRRVAPELEQHDMQASAGDDRRGICRR